MDNSTVKETWIDKLIDELVDAKDDISKLERELAYSRDKKDELDKANIRLVDTILENTRLDYDGKELRINSDTAIIYLLKLLYPDEYRERFEELKTDLRTSIEANLKVAATSEES